MNFTTVIRKGWRLFLPLLGWWMVVCSPAFSHESAAVSSLRDHPKLRSPETVLRALTDRSSTTRVIVRFRDGRTGSRQPMVRTSRTRSELRQAVKRRRLQVLATKELQGVPVGRSFSYLPAFSARVSQRQLQQLLSSEEIVLVEPDVELKLHSRQGIPLMQADNTRSTYGGQGVSIGVIDTGVDYSHPQLGGGGFPNTKVIGGYDFGDDDTDPMDTQGHGTQVAGLAAGDATSNEDYLGGTAPQAKLYALKVMGSDGKIYTSAVISALEWALTHQYDDPAHPLLVINASLGSGGFSGTCDNSHWALTQAADAAVSAGMTLFSSSGNDGYCGQIGRPACLSNVISVGAVYDDNVGGVGWCVDPSSCAANKESNSQCSTGTIAWDYSTQADQVIPFTNISTSLDLLAPSYKASTTAVGGGYSTGFSGTSAASPYAAGLGALMQSAAMAANGTYLTPTQMRDRLTAGGDSVAYAAAGIATRRSNLETTDIDGDGMPAGWEFSAFGDIEQSGEGDWDNDGLSNLEEYQRGTGPKNPDTDGDETSDGDEVAAGTDPLDPLSFPAAVPVTDQGTLLLLGIGCLVIGLTPRRIGSVLGRIGDHVGLTSEGRKKE